MKLFDCDKCKKIFSSQNFLDIHKVEEHTKKKTKCILCHDSFDSKASLQKHFQTAHDDEKLGCEHCGRDFYSKKNFRAHINRADCKMKYEKLREISKMKSVYNKSSADDGLVKIDDTKIIPEKKVEVKLVSVVNYDCNICEKRFLTNIELLQHRFHVHKKVGKVSYFCKICPSTTFKKVDFLKNHFGNAHKNGSFTKHQWGYVYECEICLKTFEKHHLLIKHQNLLLLCAYL